MFFEKRLNTREMVLHLCVISQYPTTSCFLLIIMGNNNVNSVKGWRRLNIAEVFMFTPQPLSLDLKSLPLVLKLNEEIWLTSFSLHWEVLVCWPDDFVTLLYPLHTPEMKKVEQDEEIKLSELIWLGLRIFSYCQKKVLVAASSVKLEHRKSK